MSVLTIEVNEHGVTKVRVDGESLGMMEHFEFSADSKGGPKVKVTFIKFGSAEEYALKLAELPYAEVAWVEPNAKHELQLGKMMKVKEEVWKEWCMRNGKDHEPFQAQPIVNLPGNSPFHNYVMLAFPYYWWKEEDLEADV